MFTSDINIHSTNTDTITSIMRQDNGSESSGKCIQNSVSSGTKHVAVSVSNTSRQWAHFHRTNKLTSDKMDSSSTSYPVGVRQEYLYPSALFPQRSGQSLNISMPFVVSSGFRSIISYPNASRNNQTDRQITHNFSKKSKTSTSNGVPLRSSNFGVLLSTLLLLCCSFELASGLKIVSVVVPHHQKSGESVQLQCDYDLEGDVLYSVKWYRGMNEFFRFVPAQKNQMQVFDVPGIIVDTPLSDSRRVTLRSVSRETSGKFQCEVSTDLPDFHTASMASEMLVVDFSNSVPNITGGRTRYHVGDEVHVNCTSAKSRPAASLMWYINDKQARSEELVEYAPVQDDDGLETSRLGLKFVVGAKDFPNGVLKIRCTATVAAVYWNSAEEAVEGQLPQTSPALESKGVYTGGSSPNGLSSIEYYVIILLYQISRISFMFYR